MDTNRHEWEGGNRGHAAARPYRVLVALALVALACGCASTTKETITIDVPPMKYAE